MYLFGFGSLINLKSAQKSFTRVLSQNDLIPVEIKGYKRVWNSIENIKFKDNDEEINGVFLNLQKDENASVNGVIIKITQSEFEILKLREKLGKLDIDFDGKADLNKDLGGGRTVADNLSVAIIANIKKFLCYQFKLSKSFHNSEWSTVTDSRHTLSKPLLNSTVFASEQYPPNVRK